MNKKQSQPIGIIVQARLSSQRLPGKVLKTLGGRPLLSYLIHRLQNLSVPWLIATSEDPSDDRLANFCQSQSLPCYRGSLQQVATRVYQAAQSQGWQALVRVCGDSPLLDPNLIQQAIRLYQTGPDALVSNVFPRSFPKGQSVEVLPLHWLGNALNDMSADDQEHVTAYFYRHTERYLIRNFSAPQDHSRQRLVVDTPEDFVCLESAIVRLGDRVDEASYLEVLAALLP